MISKLPRCSARRCRTEIGLVFFEGRHICAEHLIEIVQSLRDALQSVQYGFAHSRCIACAGWMVGPYGETDYAHTKTCPVNIALSKASGKVAKVVHQPELRPRKPECIRAGEKSL